jgi:CubicO group peptidase (beta-lactamase class C family)
MRPVPILVSLLCAGAVVGAATQTPTVQTQPARAQSARTPPAQTPAAVTLPRSTPEAQGISSSAILGFLEEAEQKIDALHSFMLVRHGQVVAEGWWDPYAANEPHMLFSLSKSFTSTAVGLAIADGKLTVDDPVLGFFPADAPAEPSANLKAMRVRDLLTMSTGHHEDTIRDFPYLADDSVVKHFLALPVTHKPGTFFVYNTPATYMLSAIVQKVTGQTVLDYLRPRLFEPLGIENPTWDASKQGISLGGFGLSVRTEDIAKFGQLYLQKGQWRGKQLVPAAWVEDATSRHMSNGSSPSSDWEQGYGYQFWRSRHGFYRGDGAHGQFCLVLPQYDTVIAITSGTRDLAGVMNLAWDRLVPALKAAPLPADAAAQKQLAAKLAHLTLRPLTGTSTSAGITGKRYVFAENKQSIEAIALDSADAKGGVSLTMRVAGADQHITASPAWNKQMVPLRGTPDAIAASGAWTADDTYTLKVVRYRTPFAMTYRLRFAGDQLTVDCEPNVGPAEERVTQLVGKAGSAGSQP